MLKLIYFSFILGTIYPIFCWVDNTTLQNLTKLPMHTINSIMRQLDHIEKEAENSWRGYYNIFPNLIKKHNLKIGVEIGVSTGGHSYEILKTTSVEKLYSIDPWIRNSQLGLDSDAHYDILYYRVKYRLGQFGSRSEVIRNFSHRVVHLFKDNSLDFLFIDGDHSYEGVKLDLELWYSKVKPGGFVGGDDYATSHPGVPLAVNEFFKEKNLPITLDKDQPRIWLVQKPLEN